MRHIYTKIRRHSLKEDTEPKLNSVERKLSSNWIYKYKQLQLQLYNDIKEKPFVIYRLKDDKSAVKTLWPVCCREFLFLPEFKVHKDELKSKYEIIDFIASGAFGKVYKVRHLSTFKIYALKILEKAKVSVKQIILY